MYYLAKWVEDDSDPTELCIRPGVPDGSSFAAIDLRGSDAAQSGAAVGYCLVDSRGEEWADVPGKLWAVADDHKVKSRILRRRLSNLLGFNFADADLGQFLLEWYLNGSSANGSKPNPLAVDSRRSSYNIKLAGKTLAEIPAVAGGAVMTDDFNRTNGSIGSNWTYSQVTTAGGLSVVSNEIMHDHTGNYVMYWAYTNSSAAGDAQYAEIDLISSGSLQIGPQVRMLNSAANGTGYMAYWGGADNTARIRYTSTADYPARTTLTEDTSATGVSDAPVTIRIEVDGSSLTWWHDGTELTGIATTDTTYAGGSTRRTGGVYMYSDNLLADNWAFGDLDAGVDIEGDITTAVTLAAPQPDRNANLDNGGGTGGITADGTVGTYFSKQYSFAATTLFDSRFDLTADQWQPTTSVQVVGGATNLNATNTTLSFSFKSGATYPSVDRTSAQLGLIDSERGQIRIVFDTDAGTAEIYTRVGDYIRDLDDDTAWTNKGTGLSISAAGSRTASTDEWNSFMSFYSGGTTSFLGTFHGARFYDLDATALNHEVYASDFRNPLVNDTLQENGWWLDIAGTVELDPSPQIGPYSTLDGDLTVVKVFAGGDPIAITSTLDAPAFDRNVNLAGNNIAVSPVLDGDLTIITSDLGGLIPTTSALTGEISLTGYVAGDVTSAVSLTGALGAVVLAKLGEEAEVLTFVTLPSGGPLTKTVNLGGDVPVGVNLVFGEPISYAKIWDGAAWIPCWVTVKVPGDWERGRLRIWDGAAWQG